LIRRGTRSSRQGLLSCSMTLSGMPGSAAHPITGELPPARDLFPGMSHTDTDASPRRRPRGCCRIAIENTWPVWPVRVARYGRWSGPIPHRPVLAPADPAAASGGRHRPHCSRCGR
jgi:hypothetical protein